MTELVKVVVQERQRLLREGLALLLEAEPDITVSGTAVAGPDLWDLCSATEPHVAILEADAREWDPVQLAARLKKRQPSMRLLGRFQAMQEQRARQVRRSGVEILLPPSVGIRPVVDAVRGCIDLTAHVAGKYAQAKELGVLTKREIDVLALVGAGWTTQEISGRLNISRKTVENHKQRTFRKLGVSNQAHAVSAAIRAGMLSPDGLLDLAADF